MKKLLDHMNNEYFLEELEAEAQNKSKVRKWKENHRIDIGKDQGTWKGWQENNAVPY